MPQRIWIGIASFSMLSTWGSVNSQDSKRNPVDPQTCFDSFHEEYDKGKRFLRAVLVGDDGKEHAITAQFKHYQNNTPFRASRKNTRIYRVQFHSIRFLKSPGLGHLVYGESEAANKSPWVESNGKRYWIKEAKALDDSEVWKLAGFEPPEHQVVAQKDGSLKVAGSVMSFENDPFLKSRRSFEKSGFSVRVEGGNGATVFPVLQSAQAGVGILVNSISWESKQPIVFYNANRGVLERHLVFVTSESNGKQNRSRKGAVILDRQNQPIAIQLGQTRKEIPKNSK